MAKLSPKEIEHIKLKAKNEVKAERTEEIVEKLKSLYEKQSRAEKVVANIDREIKDFEMELEG